ncbi:PIP5K2 [Symbiodinium pilosum]|uniref:PIP5K2 protein n=1 Tax=Symbiodinium pilosum TaxID=2952 RepID=A0A812YA37_SYMPI|nr:PIP5K2 [Symbiodinium pilosum]
MNTAYNIDVVAYPTNVWKLGTPGTDCEDYGANGFRLDVGWGTTPMVNLGSQGAAEVTLGIPKPPTAVNMYWTATSFRIDQDQLPQEPFTVFSDRPVSVMGTPTGRIAAFERGDVNVEQWVVLEFKPGNTVMPGTEMSGMIVIMPPPTFTIVASAAPQLPSTTYNERWVCPLADTAPFKETTYGVRLKARFGSAFDGWNKIELWEQDAAKPVAATRGIRGMEVSGPMQAALSQEKQLLGSINTIRFDIIPSQPIGNVPNTRLRVVAGAAACCRVARSFQGV